MHPVILQAIYYFIVLIMGLGLVVFLQRGFFIPYLKVKGSFGKFVLIELFGKYRNTFKVGHVEDNFLVYKDKRSKLGVRRLAIPTSDVFIRKLGLSWVHIDEETKGFLLKDLTGVTSHDPEKFENLLIRALQRPTLEDRKEMIIIIMCLLILIGIGISIYFNYQIQNKVTELNGLVNGLRILLETRGAIVPTP